MSDDKKIKFELKVPLDLWDVNKEQNPKQLRRIIEELLDVKKSLTPMEALEEECIPIYAAVVHCSDNSKELEAFMLENTRPKCHACGSYTFVRTKVVYEDYEIHCKAEGGVMTGEAVFAGTAADDGVAEEVVCKHCEARLIDGVNKLERWAEREP
jgi:hypothetical protein